MAADPPALVQCQYFMVERREKVPDIYDLLSQVGNVSPESLGYLNRVRQRNSLGPSRDGNNFAVVHCTGYIKNWPPQGIQMDRNPEDEMHASSSCCLVAIGRLQVNCVNRRLMLRSHKVYLTYLS